MTTPDPTVDPVGQLVDPDTTCEQCITSWVASRLTTSDPIVDPGTSCDVGQSADISVQILLVSSEWLPGPEVLLTAYEQNQLLLGSLLQVQMLLLPIDDYYL